MNSEPPNPCPFSSRARYKSLSTSKAQNGAAAVLIRHRRVEWC